MLTRTLFAVPQTWRRECETALEKAQQANRERDEALGALTVARLAKEVSFVSSVLATRTWFPCFAERPFGTCFRRIRLTCPTLICHIAVSRTALLLWEQIVSMFPKPDLCPSKSVDFARRSCIANTAYKSVHGQFFGFSLSMLLCRSPALKVGSDPKSVVLCRAGGGEAREDCQAGVSVGAGRGTEGTGGRKGELFHL